MDLLGLNDPGDDPVLSGKVVARQRGADDGVEKAKCMNIATVVEVPFSLFPAGMEKNEDSNDVHEGINGDIAGHEGTNTLGCEEVAKDGEQAKSFCLEALLEGEAMCDDPAAHTAKQLLTMMAQEVRANMDEKMRENNNLSEGTMKLLSMMEGMHARLKQLEDFCGLYTPNLGDNACGTLHGDHSSIAASGEVAGGASEDLRASRGGLSPTSPDGVGGGLVSLPRCGGGVGDEIEGGKKTKKEKKRDTRKEFKASYEGLVQNKFIERAARAPAAGRPEKAEKEEVPKKMKKEKEASPSKPSEHFIGEVMDMEGESEATRPFYAI